jgi:hypothetical protein
LGCRQAPRYGEPVMSRHRLFRSPTVGAALLRSSRPLPHPGRRRFSMGVAWLEDRTPSRNCGTTVEQKAVSSSTRGAAGTYTPGRERARGIRMCRQSREAGEVEKVRQLRVMAATECRNCPRKRESTAQRECAVRGGPWKYRAPWQARRRHGHGGDDDPNRGRS